MEIAGVVERVERIAEVRSTTDADAAMVQSGLVAVREARAWLDAQHAGLVARLQEVSSFPEAAIAEADRTSVGAASKSTERSETLSATPKLAGALADGAVTAGHVDAVTRTSKRLDPGHRDELLERADELVAVAAAGTVDEFRRRLELEAKRLQQGDGMDRLERQRRATCLSTWVDPDGMWNLRGKFDPVTGVKLAAKLDGTVETLFAESTPDTAPADPIEKQHHLRALALAHLVDGAGNGRSGRPEFVVVIDADAPGPGPVVEWPIPVEIPARVLAELAGEADITAVVVRNGVVLYAPGELNPRSTDTIGEPGPTTRATWLVFDLWHPWLHRRLRPLRAAPHHLVATRRPHRPRQSPAGVHEASRQHPPRRLADRARTEPRAHRHLPRRHGADHRTTRPTTTRRLTRGSGGG